MKAFLQKHVYAVMAAVFVIAWLGRSLLFFHGWPT